MDRASDAVTYIELINVVINVHHSSVRLRINMWWTVILICLNIMVNNYFPTHIYKTYFYLPYCGFLIQYGVTNYI